MTTRPIYSRRTRCRLCDSANVECVVQLAPSPPAEWYLPPERAHQAATSFPLDLFLCRSCGHVQLFDVIDPNELFSQYVYTSASSPGLNEHFRLYVDHVVEKMNIPTNALVVDVGSNDGTLLRQFARCGMRVHGIDPAKEIALAASAAGIPTLNSFMNMAAAAAVRSEVGAARLVTANNVYAHNDRLDEMTDAIAHLLADDGVFVFEVSYLLDTVQGLVFDFIYHEHLCYHSVRPFVPFLARHGLCLFDVERSPSKGGSLRGFAQKRGGPYPLASAVAQFIDQEDDAGVYDPRTYVDYMAKVNCLRDQTFQYLSSRKRQGAKIAGYGASATVTTLLHHFGIGRFFDFIVDDNPIRHGTVVPGLPIPVKAPTALYDEKPDIVVLLAWRFAKEIVQKHAAFRRTGGVFVVPVPTFQAMV